MNDESRLEILNLLDVERQTIVYPDARRIARQGLVRDFYSDGKSCEVAYSHSSESEIDQLIQEGITDCLREGYELEWKLYGHDQPHCLRERLIASGFEAGDLEAFMVLRTKSDTMEQFAGIENTDIKRVNDENSLKDYQIIMEEVHGTNRDSEVEQYRFMLENHPNNMSLYVAYVDGEAATCGRVYFHEESQFAGLYGGNTRVKYRKRGLFTQIVGVRVREAIKRGIPYICVDALPTSEPILTRLGFERLTYTQPFTFMLPSLAPSQRTVADES